MITEKGRGVKAVIYEKPPALIALEARPWVGGGAEKTPGRAGTAVAGGVDVVRAWRIHAGPGGMVSRDNAAAVITGGIELWRNLDARTAGGYGLKGSTAFIGVGLAIR
jgi:hypothetical protein